MAILLHAGDCCADDINGRARWWTTFSRKRSQPDVRAIDAVHFWGNLSGRCRHKNASPFRVKAGLHGSTSFTLSMPVSRLRLLAVRAVFGLLEAAGIVTFMIVCAWSLFPLVRGTSTFIDLLKLVVAALACLSCFYFLSVTAATVLDETWQVYGSYLVAGLAWWASVRLGLPSSANVFRFMTDASPLVTHRLPWPAMTISLLASAVLFMAALKIVQTHEY